MAQCRSCCCGGDEASSSTNEKETAPPMKEEHEMAKGMPSQINVTYADLESGGASMTSKIIDAYAGNDDFQAAGKRKLQELLARDQEDEEKLKKGIQIAVDKKSLEATVKVEPTVEVNVTNRLPDSIAEEIKKKLGDAPSKGCILTLQGLSGLGKGTTVEKLQSMLPNAQTWSNGDIFRSITLLATRFAIQEKFSDEERKKFKDIIPDLKGEGDIKKEFDARIKSLLTPEIVLTNENITSFLEMLSFDKFDGGKFDTRIRGLGEEHYVSKVNTTVLKTISKFIPAISEVTQGEVISFINMALGKLTDNGFNVFVEGRQQTLNYIPTPHRFELVIDDNTVIGKRQAALIMGGNAKEKLQQGADDVAVKKALDDEISKLEK
jgi:cytidylate kinase